MPLLDKIKIPVAKELLDYEVYLKDALQSNNEMTHTMLNYIFDSRGKAIRPLLTLLSASMYSEQEQLPSESLLSAMLVEMIHTASLVHDDVIDEAYIRRGRPSVKALWRSRRAVLIGDYILAKSYSVGMQSGAYPLIGYIVGAMTDLCEGELIQSDQSDRLEMTREIYNEIIYKKTARLIGTCSGVGAMSVGAPEQTVIKMREFGDNLGMAFQIKDDILDYTLTAKTGKPACGDLRERKITLPLLWVMERSSDAQRRHIIRLLSDIRNTPENSEKLYNIIVSDGGMEGATKVMQEYVDIALDSLQSCPTSPYRSSLEELCTYIATRDM